MLETMQGEQTICVQCKNEPLVQRRSSAQEIEGREPQHQSEGRKHTLLIT